MVLDDLSNLVHYSSLHRRFPVVSDFLFSHDISSFEPGTVSIGNGISMIFSTYTTDSGNNRHPECHRKFIDIHVIVQGSEEIGIAPYSDCETVENYDEKKDVELVQSAINRITLGKKRFAIFFPQDAHLPGLASGGVCEEVAKLVVKIPV